MTLKSRSVSLVPVYQYVTVFIHWTARPNADMLMMTSLIIIGLGVIYLLSNTAKYRTVSDCTSTSTLLWKPSYILPVFEKSSSFKTLVHVPVRMRMCFRFFLSVGCVLCEMNKFVKNLQK